MSKWECERCASGSVRDCVGGWLVGWLVVGCLVGLVGGWVSRCVGGCVNGLLDCWIAGLLDCWIADLISAKYGRICACCSTQPVAASGSTSSYSNFDRNVAQTVHDPELHRLQTSVRCGPATGSREPSCLRYLRWCRSHRWTGSFAAGGKIKQKEGVRKRNGFNIKQLLWDQYCCGAQGSCILIHFFQSYRGLRWR